MKEERVGQRDEQRRYLLDDGSINSAEVNFLASFVERKLHRIHTPMLAHSLHAALTFSAILPGQVMKSTQGQVTKILSVASAREGSSVLTDGHSIPGPRAFASALPGAGLKEPRRGLTGISLHLCASFLWQPRGTYDMSYIP